MKTTRKLIAVGAAVTITVALGATAASAAGRVVGNGFGMMGNATNTFGGFGRMGMMGGSSASGARGFGMMRGNAGAQGGCLGTTGITAASGTLTDAQKATLVALASEEKLAHDVYVTLALKYPTLRQFSMISNSEAQHMSAMDALLARYNLTDPSKGLAVGAFATVDRQQQYQELVAKAVDTTSALGVGVAIEKLDIADIASILKSVSAPDVQQVLTMLDRASDMHLVAFGG